MGEQGPTQEAQSSTPSSTKNKQMKTIFLFMISERKCRLSALGVYISFMLRYAWASAESTECPAHPECFPSNLSSPPQKVGPQ